MNISYILYRYKELFMEIEIGKYYKRNDWCYSHVLDIVRKVDEELVIFKVNEVLYNHVDEYGNHYNGIYDNSLYTNNIKVLRI
jgi:hypothetical protein